MPPTTTYRSGKDFRALVQDAIAAQDRLREAEPSRGEILRAKTRSLVQLYSAANFFPALRDRFARETVFYAEFGAAAVEKIRALPASLPLSRLPLPRLSRPRLAAAAPEIARVEADWSADLAKEYAEEFAPARLDPLLRGRAAAPSKPAKPDWLGRALLQAGHLLWRIGGFIEPAARFAYARRGLVLRATAAFVALLAGADLVAQWPSAVPVQDVAAPSPLRAGWLEIAKPLRVYDLAAPPLAHEKLAYAARRHSTGGGREDSLTFGEFDGDRLFFRLSVYRHGDEKAGDAPFFVDMARRAAPLGLSLAHVRLEQSQPTRFGDLETAALTLSEKSHSRENCRGFRLIQADPGVTLSGFACAAGVETLGAPELACLVNRLDLLAAGNDRPLRDFFGAAQARGVRGCGEIARRR